MRVLNAIVRALGTSAVITACSADTSAGIGGETVWTDVAEGQLKTQVFATDNVSDRPILILVLHGDIPNPKLDYHYLLGQKKGTEGLKINPPSPFSYLVDRTN